MAPEGSVASREAQYIEGSLNRDKSILPLLHIKLSLTKQLVKALPLDGNVTSNYGRS